jgi:hypothetical protein
MHSLSCFFLLHHHFEAVTTSPDTISISSGSINNDIMSDESDNDSETRISEDKIIEPQPDDLSRESTINPVDEDSQFIYDDDSNRLICIGSNFDDIPQTIIDAFSFKTKVKEEKKNSILF